MSATVPQENIDAAARAYERLYSVREVSRHLGISESTVARYLDKANVRRTGGYARVATSEELKHQQQGQLQQLAAGSMNKPFNETGWATGLNGFGEPGYQPPKIEEPTTPPPFSIPYAPPMATTVGVQFELLSRPDNTFCFGAFGDLHAASKYTRWEVRDDLHRRAVKANAQCVFDTGNWIDGEAHFNRYDLEAVGLDAQLQILADRYPRDGLRTYAVTGRDHEGWYVQREGIDVGRYCESIMNDASHDWIDLGYMQADILLRNANTGKSSVMRVMHPGGGTGYAVSYRPQKIIESMEGGEKPAVLLLGHYHKIDAGLVRNVWYAQTGTGQDQTPFMAQKSLEAHVGGVIVDMEQDPETGAILTYRPEMIRYFNKSYYFREGSANQRWSESGPIKAAPRAANTLH